MKASLKTNHLRFPKLYHRLFCMYGRYMFPCYWHACHFWSLMLLNFAAETPNRDVKQIFGKDEVTGSNPHVSSMKPTCAMQVGFCCVHWVEEVCWCFCHAFIGNFRPQAFVIPLGCSRITVSKHSRDGFERNARFHPLCSTGCPEIMRGIFALGKTDLFQCMFKQLGKYRVAL